MFLPLRSKPLVIFSFDQDFVAPVACGSGGLALAA